MSRDAVGVVQMSDETINRVISEIRPLSEDDRARARTRLDSLTKPAGSLGRIEDLAAWYVGITGNVSPPPLQPVVLTLAADHGVTAEGVSAYPQSVTAQMVRNFIRGGAAVNVLARHAGASLHVADVGVAEDLGAHAGLLHHKIAHGTKNFLHEPAMSYEHALTSLHVGMNLAHAACAEGNNLLAVGEMGIGNTTASAAIASVLTGSDVERVTGRGTGVEGWRLRRKISVVKRALARHRPSPDDVVDTLAKVGGFEIGGMAGLMLGAASRRVPVVLDGFITGVSALIAVALAPRCREYLLASHLSEESGHRIVLDHLNLEPLLDLRMRLGEGTGACLAVTLMQAALNVYSRMATFEEAGVAGVVRES